MTDQLPFDHATIEHVYVSFSGGKDSTASLLRVLEVFPPEKVTAIFGDTGAELPDAYDYMRWFDANVFPIVRAGQRIVGTRQITRGGRLTEINSLENVYLGWDEPVGARGVLTLLELIQQDKKRRPDSPGWPSPTNRFCTKALKQQSVFKYIRHQTPDDTAARSKCLHVVGLRRAESANRANTPDYEFNYDIPAQQWYPVAAWSADDVINYVAAKGVPLSPVYRHVSRANCGICFFAADSEIITVERAYPGYLDEYVALENKIGSTWKAGRSLSELQQIAQFGDTAGLPLFAGLDDRPEEPLTCMTGHCDMGGGSVAEEHLWTPGQKLGLPAATTAIPAEWSNPYLLPDPLTRLMEEVEIPDDWFPVKTRDRLRAWFASSPNYRKARGVVREAVSTAKKTPGIRCTGGWIEVSSSTKRYKDGSTKTYKYLRYRWFISRGRGGKRGSKQLARIG